MSTTSPNRRATRSFRARLFPALAIGLALLVCEGAARFWLHVFAPTDVYPLYALASEFPQAAKYAPHHYACYTLQPNYQKGATRHNALGYRGPEIAQPKPAGVYRIAVLGGSTTYGEFIDDDRQTFPAQLERKLHERGLTSVEVINAGVPGYNSWESLVDLQFRVLDLEPDLVIPYYGVNDVHCRLVEPDAYRPDNSGRRHVWRDPLDVQILRYSLLSRIVGFHLGLWQNPGVDSYVKGRPAYREPVRPGQSPWSKAMAALDCNGIAPFKRNLRMTAAVCESAGAHVLFATWAHCPAIGDYSASPPYQRGIAELNDAIRSVALELGITCYDFALEMPNDVNLWRDGRHVNARGAERQAERFADFLAHHADAFGLNFNTSTTTPESRDRTESVNSVTNPTHPPSDRASTRPDATHH